jgi:hypothetical protein
MADNLSIYCKQCKSDGGFTGEGTRQRNELKFLVKNKLLLSILSNSILSLLEAPTPDYVYFDFFFNISSTIGQLEYPWWIEHGAHDLIVCYGFDVHRLITGEKTTVDYDKEPF